MLVLSCRGSCGCSLMSVPFAEVQRVGLVHEVALSGALIPHLGCDEVEGLTKVSDVDRVGLSHRTQLRVQLVDLLGNDLIAPAQLVDLGPEMRPFGSDRGEQTVLTE